MSFAVRSSRGQTGLVVMSVIGAIMILPTIYLANVDKGTEGLIKEVQREKLKEVTNDFPLVMTSAFRAETVCTLNLESLGYVGKSETELENKEFIPRMLDPINPTMLREANISADSELGPLLNGFKIRSTRLNFKEARSATTSIYKLILDIGPPEGSKTSLAVKAAEVIMMVEVDAAKNILSCQISQFYDAAQTLLLEDKVCQVSKGPQSRFEMKGRECS